LTTAATELPDEDFKKLSKDAKAWVDGNVDAHNEEHPMNDFPIANGKGVETKEDKVTDAPAPTGKKKSTKKAAPAPAPAPKKKAAAPAPAPKKKAVAAKPPTTSTGNGKDRGEKSARKVGAQTMIKKLMLKDPNISTKDVVEKLDKAGFKMSSLAVSTIRSGFRHSLKVIQEEGLLKSVKIT